MKHVAHVSTCLGSLPWSCNKPVPSKGLKRVSVNSSMIYHHSWFEKEPFSLKVALGVGLPIFKVALQQGRLQVWYLEWSLPLNRRLSPAMCFRQCLLFLSSHRMSLKVLDSLMTEDKKHAQLFLFIKHNWVMRSLGWVRGISCILEGIASSIISNEESIPALCY